MEPYELRRGNYKNLTLRLVPPRGDLVVSAPWYLPRGLIDRFVADRAAWIAQKRQSLSATPAPGGIPEGLWVWGRWCPLRVESPGTMPRVVVTPEGTVVLRVPASWTTAQHLRCLARWEVDRVHQALESLIPAWSQKTGLAVHGWTVKTLRSRWGSCRPDTRTLVFNSRLGAYPPECLEHVVVHELAHLVEAHHNDRFHGLVEGWMPGSKAIRARLRQGPGPASPTGPDVFPDSGATLEEEREL